VISGIIMLLPFIGPPLSIIPPVLLVLLQSSSSDLGLSLLLLIVALIIAQQVVMQMLAPRIFGAQMGIHPLLLFAALLVGAKLGGVWGAFFAGPIIAVAFAMAKVYYNRFAEASPLFRRQSLAVPLAATRAEKADAEDERIMPKDAAVPSGTAETPKIPASAPSAGSHR
jgi:predicted PurR-regulated permease PerM